MGQSTIDLNSINEIANLSQKHSNVPNSFISMLYNISISHNTKIIICKFYNKPSHLVRLQNGRKVLYKCHERIKASRSTGASGPQYYQNESNAKSIHISVSNVFNEMEIPVPRALENGTWRELCDDSRLAE